MMQQKRSWVFPFIWLLLGWMAFYGFMLGSRPLATPDEGRYVEIPREMVTSGDYVTPRLNGVKYFEKPPLFYWLQALSIRWWGIHEWGLRFWVAVFAIMGCVLTYWMGRLLFNPQTGLWGSLILSTSPLYFGLGHLIILDLPVSVLMNGTLFFFLAQYHPSSARQARFFRLSAFVCAALAVLTKGLMACILPALVLGIWILSTPHKHRLKDLFCPWGWLVFLTLTVPWHGAVMMRNPEFGWFYFVHEHVLRFLTQTHRRYQPFWFFIPVFAVGFAPWTAFLTPLLERARSWWCDEKQRLLMLWSGFIFLFFSLSGSKLAPYILPIFPSLSLLVGHHLAQALQHKNPEILRATFKGRIVLACLLIGALLFGFVNDASFHTWRHGLLLSAMILAWCAGLFWEWFWGHCLQQWPKAMTGLLGATACFLLLVHGVAEDIQQLSIKPLAKAIKADLRPQDKVFVYEHYDQDLPVYLERIVGVVDYRGELEFGTTVEDTRSWMMTSHEFWPVWKGPDKVFVFMRKQTYEILRQDSQWAHVKIAETVRDVVLSNR